MTAQRLPPGPDPAAGGDGGWLGHTPTGAQLEAMPLGWFATSPHRPAIIPAGSNTRSETGPDLVEWPPHVSGPRDCANSPEAVALPEQEDRA